MLWICKYQNYTFCIFPQKQVTGNKMTSLNLATIFGPNLLHKQKSSDKEFSVQSSARAEESTAVIAVLQRMIASFQTLFTVSCAHFQHPFFSSLTHTLLLSHSCAALLSKTIPPGISRQWMCVSLRKQKANLVKKKECGRWQMDVHEGNSWSRYNQKVTHRHLVDTNTDIFTEKVSLFKRKWENSTV